MAAAGVSCDSGGDKGKGVPGLDCCSDLEFVMLHKKDVFVYKIPPRPAHGHRAEDWKECVWRGRLQIAEKGESCAVSLIDATSGKLFAKCPITENYDLSVERTVDSSRYFVLKVESGSGRHAFIGMGFESRNDAFDFNCALSDYSRRRQVEVQEHSRSELSDLPQKDYSLKEGQKIKVNLKGLKTRHRDQRPLPCVGTSFPAPPHLPPPSSSPNPPLSSARSPQHIPSSPPPTDVPQPSLSSDFAAFTDFPTSVGGGGSCEEGSVVVPPTADTSQRGEDRHRDRPELLDIQNQTLSVMEDSEHIEAEADPGSDTVVQDLLDVEFSEFQGCQSVTNTSEGGRGEAARDSL
eukprot:GHVQ01001579.1.p1 GENE.GHVQ01001579.1~~GHVQ01001579.1.p1  ORF type:complete len:349 (-),score=81.08 GHVQ01001579.1:1269-2315(-)